MIQFDVITLFPQLFSEHLNNLPFKKAISKNLVKVKLWNLRDCAMDKRGTVDDKPYGGGTGMILMIEPLFNTLRRIYGDSFTSKKDIDPKSQKIVLLSPAGKKYDQKMAGEFTAAKQITLICGRYEGIDARVAESLATDVVSIGDYVLSGGEIPALAIMESVTRLIPGVLEKEDANKIESFSDGYIEYPQYTRPEDFNGLKVPEILLSGDHKKIADWREKRKQKI
jgi:tRNA (guanine37-N1)-methyltransferase